MVPQISQVNSCMDVIRFLILMPPTGPMCKNERRMRAKKMRRERDQSPILCHRNAPASQPATDLAQSVCVSGPGIAGDSPSWAPVVNALTATATISSE